MKTLQQQLINYARYHRDRRNIHSHFVGIPLIVLAVATLLARAEWAGLSLAHGAVALVVGYYLLLDKGLGLCMALLMALALWGGVRLAVQPFAVWLGWGAGMFVAGWGIQFAGHVFEGRKPAFVDDLAGLVIGPLFVVAEWLFLLGCYRALQQQIDAAAGPVRRGRPAPGK